MSVKLEGFNKTKIITKNTLQSIQQIVNNPRVPVVARPSFGSAEEHDFLERMTDVRAEKGKIVISFKEGSLVKERGSDEEGADRPLTTDEVIQRVIHGDKSNLSPVDVQSVLEDYAKSVVVPAVIADLSRRLKGG